MPSKIKTIKFSVFHPLMGKYKQNKGLICILNHANCKPLFCFPNFYVATKSTLLYNEVCCLSYILFKASGEKALVAIHK